MKGLMSTKFDMMLDHGLFNLKVNGTELTEARHKRTPYIIVRLYK